MNRRTFLEIAALLVGSSVVPKALAATTFQRDVYTKGGLSYVRIYRNASRSIIKAMGDDAVETFVPLGQRYDPPGFSFAVLRPPIARYVSAYANIWSFDGRDRFEVPKRVLGGEGHFVRQVTMLAGIRVDKFFIMQPGEELDLSELGLRLEHIGRSPIIPSPDEQIVEKVSRFYEQDYALLARHS